MTKHSTSLEPLPVGVTHHHWEKEKDQKKKLLKNIFQNFVKEKQKVEKYHGTKGSYATGEQN